MKKLTYYTHTGSGLFAFLAVVTLIAAVFWGWLLNLYWLAQHASETVAINLEVVLRVLGIFFAPIGALMGYFG